ncbi:MAG TPA: cysteine desulfurase [Ignavibacteria bacterium]|nr:cysteine desulfurase [Ignavibacteria bacterium]
MQSGSKILKFDVDKLRSQFPILTQKINGKPLVYFDNAATSQKPLSVLEKVYEYYTTINSNVHRGIHTLSEKATIEFETAREKSRKFLNAISIEEIIFTKGVTDGINLVAFSFGEKYINAGDEIVISEMEHHSNIVPWQMLCERKNAKLKVIPVNEKGELIIDEYKNLLSEKVKIVAVTHVSNSLGTINPVKEIIEIAHSRNIPVLLDGAQAAPHLKIDVQELDVDFYVISSHKFYGPTGSGVLYGKEKFLESMPPYQGGGEMIKSVSFSKTLYNELPYKFEAGTPNIAGAIGMGSAIDFIENLGYENISTYENELLHYATDKLNEIDGMRIIGTAKHKASVVSFIINGIHPYDTGSILDQLGIAVRTGYHCTQPLIDFYKLPGTVRASFAVYNTFEEIDRLIEGIHKVKKMIG